MTRRKSRRTRRAGRGDKVYDFGRQTAVEKEILHPYNIANDAAFPFYALNKLRFFENAPTAVAYAVALKMQFPDLPDLK